MSFTPISVNNCAVSEFVTKTVLEQKQVSIVSHNRFQTRKSNAYNLRIWNRFRLGFNKLNTPLLHSFECRVHISNSVNIKSLTLKCAEMLMLQNRFNPARRWAASSERCYCHWKTARWRHSVNCTYSTVRTVLLSYASCVYFTKVLCIFVFSSGLTVNMTVLRRSQHFVGSLIE